MSPQAKFCDNSPGSVEMVRTDLRECSGTVENGAGTARVVTMRRGVCSRLRRAVTRSCHLEKIELGAVVPRDRFK